MLLLQNWIWKVYFSIYLLLAVVNAGTFFDPETDIAFYYQALIGYDRLFFFPYTLNLFAVIFTILATVPFYGFVFNRQFLSPSLWRLFFALRLSFDITGHSYEFKTIKALFYHDPSVGFHFLFLVLILFTPSYVALYRYSFKKPLPPR